MGSALTDRLELVPEVTDKERRGLASVGIRRRSLLNALRSICSGLHHVGCLCHLTFGVRIKGFEVGLNSHSYRVWIL